MDGASDRRREMERKKNKTHTSRESQTEIERGGEAEPTEPRGQVPQERRQEGEGKWEVGGAHSRRPQAPQTQAPLPWQGHLGPSGRL